MDEWISCRMNQAVANWVVEREDNKNWLSGCFRQAVPNHLLILAKFLFMKKFSVCFFAALNYIPNDFERSFLHFRMEAFFWPIHWRHKIWSIAATDSHSTNQIQYHCLTNKASEDIFNGSQWGLIRVLVSRHVLIGYELKLVKTFVGQICDIDLQ